METFNVGRYPVTAVLGSGGFGTVYAGTHPDTGIPVAVKVMDRLAEADPWLHQQLREQLYAEAAALRAIDDRHCVRVHDVVELDDVAALVTDLVDGASLRAVLTAHGRMDPRQALGVLRGAVRGLVAVHAAGLVHGDLKPDNILLDRQGVSHLIDFGLAAPPRTAPRADGTTGSGTPSYMSPEQIRSGVTDVRSDVYACAATLFELLVARKPYVGTDADDVLLQHLNAPVPDPRSLEPDVGDELARLCLSGLAKDPAHRPQTAAQFLRRLEHAARARYGAAWAAGAGAGGLVGAVVAAGSGTVPLAGAAGAAGSAVGAATVGVGSGAGAAVGSTSGLASALGGAKALAAFAVAAVVATTATVALMTRDGADQQAAPTATDPTSAAPAVAPAEPTRPAATIRDTDLDNTRWFDAVLESPVRLRNGSSAGPLGVRYSRGGEATPADPALYLDADGDGDEDVLAPLTYLDGNGYRETWYFWLWDADAERAVQLRHPIAETARCGSAVKSIRVRGGSVAITEALRDPFGFSTESCAEDGPIRVTRQVAVDNDLPVLLTGAGGYGGVCPPTTVQEGADVRTGAYYGEPGEGPIVLRAGPDAGSARLRDPQIRLWTAMGPDEYANAPWLAVDGWVPGHFFGRGGSRFEAYGGYQPCAFLRLAD